MPEAKKADERKGERGREGEREKGRVGERDGVKRKEAKKRESERATKNIVFSGLYSGFIFSFFLSHHSPMSMY